MQTPAKKRPFKIIATPEKQEEGHGSVQEAPKTRLRKKTRVSTSTSKDAHQPEAENIQDAQEEGEAKKKRKRLTIGQRWFQS